MCGYTQKTYFCNFWIRLGKLKYKSEFTLKFWGNLKGVNLCDLLKHIYLAHRKYMLPGTRGYNWTNLILYNNNIIRKSLMMRKHSLNMLLHMFPSSVVWHISLPNGQSLAITRSLPSSLVGQLVDLTDHYRKGIMYVRWPKSTKPRHGKHKPRHGKRKPRHG